MPDRREQGKIFLLKKFMKKENQQEIKIEHNIPIPPSRGRGNEYWIKIFNEMKPGDSFFLPDGKIQTVYAKFRYSMLKTRSKITTRKEGNGVRVWLVSRENHEISS